MTAPDVNADVHARSMETAPRDGTMLRLLVRFTEHATDDAEEAWTIGANSLESTGEDHWQFAGWSWTHDHFTEGKGTPIGWLPMHDPHADLSGEVRELVEDAERALTAWDSTTLPRVNDGMLQERMESLRAALAKFTQEKP